MDTNNYCVECEQSCIKTEITNCKSCKKEISVETAIPCELCDVENENNSYDEDIIYPLFCENCTNTCNACEVIGCKKCVEFACCDCGYDMCYNCRNYDNIKCGCYGNCYTCGIDINRGYEGWPCRECDKWYCDNCREGNNPCKHCGPYSNEEEVRDED